MNLLSFFTRGASVKALSALDDRRLSDLGLNRYDLFEARGSRCAASLLEIRRSERAEFWLR
jgi:hypothetical protein